VGVTLLNRFSPTLRVEWKPALIGGATSGVLLELSKWGLGLYLGWVSGKYRSIYGTLGVLPLFLLSLYLWWVILLIGAEVCRAVQRLPLLRHLIVGRHRHPSGDRFAHLRGELPTISGPLAARLLCDVARNWKRGKQAALPILDLEQHHGLPESVVRRIMQKLALAGLVAELDSSYLLTRPPEDIRLDEVLHLFHDFAPPAADPSDPDSPAAADPLDQVLRELDDKVRSQAKSVTFAHLV
jgi:membrane protein